MLHKTNLTYDNGGKCYNEFNPAGNTNILTFFLKPCPDKEIIEKMECEKCSWN